MARDKHGRDSETKAKRKRKRTVSRTAVDLSSSSSDSESSSASSSSLSSSSSSSASQSRISSPHSAEEPASTSIAATTRNADALATNFSAWYLRQVTREFGEDLEKVRGAGDFKEASVGVLVSALKQGGELFGVEERARILGGAG